MSLTDGRRWSQMHEFHLVRVLRAQAILVNKCSQRHVKYVIQPCPLPLIFTLVAASISHFLTAAI